MLFISYKQYLGCAINKGFRFLLSITDIYGKYAWVIPLKVKRRNYNY